MATLYSNIMYVVYDVSIVSRTRLLRNHMILHEDSDHETLGV